MKDVSDAVRLSTFHEHRGLLFSIAYRMLGSVADAEDMLQETYIRWQQADEEPRNPRALLVTIISRLCINYLESARVKRVEYVGQWLPEPLMTDQDSDPLGVLRLDESLSMALMVLLERLTATERAVFLLREVFSYRYTEIAHILGQTEVNCRQIFRRAREHVGAMRQRFEASAQDHMALLERFIDASRKGDIESLVTMLADDVALHSDGGGKAVAVPNVVRGIENVSRGLILGAQRTLPFGLTFKAAWINGQPGVVSRLDGEPFSVLILDIRKSRISSVYIVTNPDKLEHLSHFV